MKKSMKKLKPRPFCGGKASHVYDPDGTIDTEKRTWRYTIAWCRRVNDDKHGKV